METALADLRLDDEEEIGEGMGWEIEQDLETREEDFENCLVGCFLTATTINFQSMKSAFANLWHPLGGVTITDIGEKRYLFQFYYEADKTRIVNSSPWTFNNHLFVFTALSNGMDSLEVPLLKVGFWVQIHNLPSGMYTE